MTPRMPVQQIGSRAAYYVCPGSKNWRKAFLQLVDQVSDAWGFRGFMFYQLTEFVGGGAFIVGRPGAYADAKANDF